MSEGMLWVGALHMGFRALGVSQRVFGVEGIVYEKEEMPLDRR